jgi:hypothetical protein
MRSTALKWWAGTVAFFLPTITIFVLKVLLRQSVPPAFWGSIIFAGVVPPALLLSCGVTGGRIALAFGLWLLLAVQFCVILLCLLAGFRE